MSFASELLDRVDSVRDKVREHLKTSKELLTFMSDVISAEEDYVKKLKTLCDKQASEEKRKNLIGDSTVITSLWRLFRKEVENTYLHHEQFVATVTKDGIKPFETYLDQARKERMQADLEYDKCVKSLDKAKDLYEKTRQKYVKAGCDELSESKSPSPNEQKLKKLKLELERSEAEHKRATKQYADTKEAFDGYAKEELTKCEALEGDRIDEYVKFGKAFFSTQETLGRCIQHTSLTAKDKIISVQKDAEIQALIESLKTGKEAAPKIEFIPLQPFELEGDGSTSGFRLSYRFPKLHDVSSSDEKGHPDETQQPKPSPRASSSSNAESGVPSAKSKMNNVFSSITSQQILRPGSGFLRRVSNPKQENQPSDEKGKDISRTTSSASISTSASEAPESISKEQSSVPAFKPLQRERKKSITTLSMTATEDYDAATPEELTLRIGDVIVDVLKGEGDSWVGTLRGIRGKFPWRCVKTFDPFEKQTSAPETETAIKNETSPSAPEPKSEEKATAAIELPEEPATSESASLPIINKKPVKHKVAYKFTASDEDELSVEEGDVVVVFGEIDGWAFIRDKKGITGLCPANYLEKM